MLETTTQFCLGMPEPPNNVVSCQDPAFWHSYSPCLEDIEMVGSLQLQRSKQLLICHLISPNPT